MDFLPIFLDVRQRLAVIVGGGEVAARKAELLLEAGAAVRIVAPTLGVQLQALRDAQRIEHRAEAFTPQTLDGAVVVIAATEQRAVNAAVAAAARARGIPINAVDDLKHSDFIMPAIVDRSPVVVAVGTSGNSPVLARFVRERIETLLPPRLGRLAAFAGRWRRRVARRLETVLQRRRFWERVLSGPLASHVLEGRDEQADFELRRELKQAAQMQSLRVGEVYLIGAGPGDPDLLTLKAARLLQQADVVLYDRLVPDAIVARARRDAERVYVGKESGNHHVTQEQIHELLVQYALAGKRVCRLKGGDPFVFGRGGEELEALVRHKIPFTVVPGITAALGAAAYAGIPLTHRDHAQSVTFVTGHTRESGAPVDWHELTRPGQTVVFYMGLSQLRTIFANLIEAGAPESLPAALVAQATLPEQRVIVGTLATLAQQAEAQGVQSPALLIVGDVVKLRAVLANAPRSAPRAAVASESTRSRAQSA
ncbi:MAG TPA: siroheme synthase CysG [Steroidobacteraceae bacterium]|nr:siroheme synthase CysG [Steroidobacteraceae bacterium]